MPCSLPVNSRLQTRLSCLRSQWLVAANLHSYWSPSITSRIRCNDRHNIHLKALNEVFTENSLLQNHQQRLSKLAQVAKHGIPSPLSPFTNVIPSKTGFAKCSIC